MENSRTGELQINGVAYHSKLIIENMAVYFSQQLLSLSICCLPGPKLQMTNNSNVGSFVQDYVATPKATLRI